MLKTPSLIETVRVREGRAPLWHLHLRRLVASCRALGIPFPLEFEVPSGGTDRVQRIVVGMNGKQVTEREVGSVEPVRLITARAVAPTLSSQNRGPNPVRGGVGGGGECRGGRWADAYAGRNGRRVLRSGRSSGGMGRHWWLLPPRLGILPSVSRARIAEIGPVMERSVPREALNGVPIIAGKCGSGHRSGRPAGRQTGSFAPRDGTPAAEVLGHRILSAGVSLTDPKPSDSFPGSEPSAEWPWWL